MDDSDMFQISHLDDTIGEEEGLDDTIGEEENLHTCLNFLEGIEKLHKRIDAVDVAVSSELLNF